MRLDPDADGALCPTCRRDLPSPGEPLCPGCGIAAAAAAASFCPSCRGRHAMDAVVFAAPYAGTAKELVHRFKYRADFAAGRFLAHLLATRIEAALPGGVDLLVPVPLHRWRLAGRGFNQAALLAREIARRLGLPVAVAALAPRQQHADARRAPPRGALAASCAAPSRCAARSRSRAGGSSWSTTS